MSKLIISILLGLTATIYAQNNPFDSLDILAKTSIYFNFGKYDITPESAIILDSFALFCNGEGIDKLSLEAHTDVRGSTKDNMLLSQKRASSTKAYLKKRISSEINFTSNELGETMPRSIDGTEAGHAQNRRVDIAAIKVFRMIKIEGQIVDQESNKGIPARIYFNTQEAKDSIETDPSGNFSKDVRDHTVVGLDVYAEGYFYETRIIKVIPSLPKLQFSLPILKANAVADINNLYFVGNQAILLKHSYPQLDKLYYFLDLNPMLKIEIAGHINAPNQDPETLSKDRFELSVRRAKMVYDFLINRGIDPKRLKYEGYGNRFMKYPKAKLEKFQKLNRRVEIKVLETGVVISKADKPKN